MQVKQLEEPTKYRELYKAFFKYSIGKPYKFKNGCRVYSVYEAAVLVKNDEYTIYTKEHKDEAFKEARRIDVDYPLDHWFAFEE